MQEEAGMVGQHTYNDVGIVVLYFFLCYYNIIFCMCILHQMDLYCLLFSGTRSINLPEI